MTNAARIRQDSLWHPQVQNLARSGSTPAPTSAPVPCESTGHRRPVVGDSKPTKEQGKRILRESPGKRSEPFPEEIAAAIQNFRLAQQRLNQDGALDDSTDEIDQVVVATAEQPISEPAAAAASSTPSTPDSTPSNPSLVLARPRPNSKRKGRQSLTRPPSVSSTSPGISARRLPRSLRPPPTPPPESIKMSRPVSLLVASLGNPAPYHSTRHSAAHLVLKSLQPSLGLPSFTQKSKPYGGGHVSEGSAFTLYQSAVQMNVSGPPILKAWRYFSGTQDAAGRATGLVVLHDEMEIASGALKIRRGNASAKGHNGIKSVQSSLQSAGLLTGPNGLGDRFVRIGVGIGRPTGGTRDSRDVSAYVLGQLTSREKEGLERSASELEGLLYAEMARIAQVAG